MKRAGVTRWITLFILAAAIAGGAFVGLRLLRPLVSVTNIVRGPVVQAFYATGTVQPVREFPVGANHAGLITQMLVDKGDHVTLGQPLAVVEDQQYRFAVDKANADLKEDLARADPKTSPVLMEFDAKIDAAKDQLGTSQREADRVAGLQSHDAATSFDADRAADRVSAMKSDLASLQSQRAMAQLSLQRDVDVARAAVQTAQYDVNQQTIVSPVDGNVLDRPLSLGTRVAVNDHLMRVADVRPANLVMRAQVDEEDKTFCELGQTVRMTLYAFPGRIFSGAVSRIYDQADSERRTFEVDVKFASPDAKLAAGMTGELAFIMAEKNEADVVPSQSLQQGNIYVIHNGRIAKADTRIGLKSVQRVEILSGLAKDDEVIVSPLGNLHVGDAVRTDFIDPTTAADLNKTPDNSSDFHGFNGG